MQPHFIGHHRHPGIVQTAHDGVHAAGIAGIENEKLRQGLDPFGHLHNLVGADQAGAAVQPAVETAGDDVVLAL